MRTLALLTALLLLALQAQAETLPDKVEEAPEQEQPEEEDKDMTISFGGAESSSALQAAGQRKSGICRCKPRGCNFLERVSGICVPGRNPHVLCCRRA